MAIKATVEGDHSLCHFFPTLVQPPTQRNPFSLFLRRVAISLEINILLLSIESNNMIEK